MSVPPITNSMSTVQAQSVRAHDTSSPSTSSGNSLNESSQSVESTFLTLLAQELQNQDPTQPMDSTEMVGQMISLNQLNELASINQVLTNSLGVSSSANLAAAQPGAPQAAVAAMSAPGSTPARSSAL